MKGCILGCKQKMTSLPLLAIDLILGLFNNWLIFSRYSESSSRSQLINQSLHVGIIKIWSLVLTFGLKSSSNRAKPVTTTCLLSNFKSLTTISFSLSRSEDSRVGIYNRIFTYVILIIY